MHFVFGYANFRRIACKCFQRILPVKLFREFFSLVSPGFQAFQNSRPEFFGIPLQCLGAREKGDSKWEKPVSAKICGFLRFPAKICSFLRFYVRSGSGFSLLLSPFWRALNFRFGNPKCSHADLLLTGEGETKKCVRGAACDWKESTAKASHGCTRDIDSFSCRPAEQQRSGRCCELPSLRHQRAGHASRNMKLIFSNYFSELHTLARKYHIPLTQKLKRSERIQFPN